VEALAVLVAVHLVLLQVQVRVVHHGAEHPSGSRVVENNFSNGD
jgi:hypothetical protein